MRAVVWGWMIPSWSRVDVGHPSESFPHQVLSSRGWPQHCLQLELADLQFRGVKGLVRGDTGLVAHRPKWAHDNTSFGTGVPIWMWVFARVCAGLDDGSALLAGG